MRILLPLLTALILTGCATFNKYDIRAAKLQRTPSAGTVAVAGIDERDYLKRGEISPDYVGMTRGGYGNPFQVKTATKLPLALEAAEVVAGSFGDKSPAPAVWDTEQAGALAKLRASDAPRFVILRITKWESDTLIRTSLDYSVSIEVVDRSGKTIASAAESKIQPLGGNFFVPAMHARQSVLSELGNILNRLLAQPQVAAALR